MKENRNRWLIALLSLAPLAAFVEAANDSASEQAKRIVSEIQRADYEGNQVALKKGYQELAPLVENKQLASRVRYWRGFDKWRSAINGFNDSVDPKEIEQNLKVAIDEFKEAIAKDPAFVEAKIGLVSCLGYFAFVNRNDAAKVEEFKNLIAPIVKEVKQAAPDNPRLIWVLGPMLWNAPPDKGGGQDKAIESYERGLEIYSKIKASDDPLEPSWGKPELMMSLAYSYLNRKEPDVNAAERNARGALEIVPYWHYTRDILLPQILAAKTKAN